MSDAPLYDAMQRNFVRKPFIAPELPRALWDSRQLHDFYNKYHEEQAEKDEAEYQKTQKKGK
jgi:hypothetical protein